MKPKTIKVADLFCGAGGTSCGMIDALESLGHKVELTAVNHWSVAIATHTANHPGSRHLCTGVDNINPRELYGDGDLDILWASPECMHHSVARGGRPINDQSRSTAWCVVRWAEAVRPSIILVENVKEFPTWGPVGRNGRPIKRLAGQTFSAWDTCFKSLGYRRSFKVLKAADYGDPTTRERFFYMAVLAPLKCVFPFPTHAQNPMEDLLQAMLKPWVPARDIIDWDIESPSIFTRKRQLKPKTLKRIFHGIEKFGLKPFIVPKETGETGVHSVDRPLKTVTTESRGEGLAEPFLVHLRGTSKSNSVEQPLPTVCTSGHFALCEPFLVDVNHGDDKKSGKRKPTPLDATLGTVTCKNGKGLVIPGFVLQQQSGGSPRSTDNPLPTIATAGAQALIQPFLIAIDHRGAKGHYNHPIDQPLTTITTKARHALVEPFVMKYNRTGKGKPVSVPLDTVTTKDRFALVQPEILIDGERYRLDIRFRMLQPHELWRAQGFPADYLFSGTKTEQVKQIGNAVPAGLSRALVQAVVSQNPNVGRPEPALERRVA